MKREKAKTKKNRLPHFPSRSLAWTGYVTSSGVQSLVMGYLTFYLTENVMLSAAIVSAIIASARVFDGISDIIAGLIIDKTHTKIGKARPYSIFTLLMWLFTVLVFSVPGTSTAGKVIYVAVFYNLSESISRTMLYASENVHYKISFNSEEQLDVVGITGLIGGIANMLVAIVIPQLISNYGVQKNGWTMIALVFAVPCTVMGMLKLFLLPETQNAGTTDTKQKNVPLKEIPGLLIHNKYLLIFLTAMLCKTIVFNMASSAGTYYYTYIVGDVSVMSTTSALGMVSMLIMPLIPVVSRKLGMKRFISYSMLFGAVGMGVLYAAPTNLGTLSLYIIANALGTAPFSMLSTVMSIQCMKYSEWKNGVAIDGVIASCSGFVSKIGAALGAVIIGACLTAGGYSKTLSVQPESAFQIFE
jgi:GPH family glycoside/pentoside/hexuronide:cation symporter